MKIHAFVPAKGNSSRIKNKNELTLFGEPLYINALKKLEKCNKITSFFIDTESDKFIRDVQNKIKNCSIMKRDINLANNQTDGNRLLINEAMFAPADIYIQLLGTSPFIQSTTIEKAINILLENPKYDSVIAVKREKLYLWNEKGPLYDLDNIPNSFDLEDTIIETMGLYVIRHEALFDTQKRIGKTPYLLSVSPIEAIDINYPEDYDFAKIIEKGLISNE